MRELLSVIVPCYNEGAVIERTAKAIVDTCTGRAFDFEIIFVNDGSKDGSAIICDKLALNPKVRVIHQENRGASTTRNVGLSLAQGDYV